ncbi:carboxymuconolactone decarboxylase family protein [Flavisolibacter ginsengisoli]|jgi:alkyl hydroperoxide reductase subunit D|uniref:Alkyl hydroperoxide reductase AhpD n=1 Tax=Flavisolibacter ginsengisoli DSM 18119 TaxID=1121884 RepID=A0A1M4Y209_9BACT|nr:carboxymuconolactone decarboxylase family protein [Flavisolibacter ginsengisoli]SHE99867.1 alkyl hydroperoxide reductase subunit D [Flavisolibacter ginsengisoli DSM 18119]
MFGIASTTDNALALLTEIGLTEENITGQLRVLAQTDSRYLKDLKINVTNSLNAGTFTKKEAYLLAYAVAVNEKNEVLQKAFGAFAEKEGASDKELAEIISCTSLLNANNVYYRFRHFMHDEFYNNTQAGIRMSIMANPLLGKEFFELVSLAVSALNGCELCVTSHEKTLIGHGTAKQRIHDAIRLTAVIKSLAVLL